MIINFINFIDTLNEMAKLSNQVNYKWIKKEVKKIDPYFSVKSESQGGHKKYWLIDTLKKDPFYTKNPTGDGNDIHFFSNYFETPIEYYEEKDLNDLLTTFKKYGEQYLKDNRMSEQELSRIQKNLGQ